MMNELVVLESLTKHFGDTIAVDNISLTVRAGEVFGLLGPNGAGKTTTVRMLTALISPTSGTAWVAGCQLGKEDMRIREQVGILTEFPGLYNRLSAEKNLEFYAKLYDVTDVEKRVEHYLHMMGLWERRDEAVATFSKGMRQRLAIARALLHEPKVLFLDEPTSGLDPEVAKMVREYIARLKRDQRAIVICTHNLDEANRLCDRVAVLKNRLLAMDAPETLRSRLYGRSVVFHLEDVQPGYQEFINAFPWVNSVQVTDNKIVVGLDNPEMRNPTLIEGLVQTGARIQFVGEIRHTLEDVYLRLMEKQNG